MLTAGRACPVSLYRHRPSAGLVTKSLWFLLSVLCLAFLFPCQPRFHSSHGIRWWLATTTTPR